MLQISLSSPDEIDDHCESRTTGRPVQSLPAFLNTPHTRQDRDEEHATQSRWIRGCAEEACLWEDEGGGGLLVTPLSQQSDGKGLRRRATYDSTDQLRSLGDEGDTYSYEETRVPDAEDYKAEEDLSLNSSDLSMEGESDVVTKLVHAQNCLKKINAELQETVDVTEDSNAILRSENSMLRNQVKGMRQAVDNAKQLMDEVEEMRGSLAELAKAKGKLETIIKQMEKENEMLKNQLETLTNEMCNTSERQIDKEKIIHLSSLLQDLEKDMERTRLTLDHKEEVIQKKDFQIEQLESSQAEYSLIVQDLKEKLKDLEDQLAEALITGEGSFQDLDGTFCPTARSGSVSLCEELRLLQHVSAQEPYEEETEVADDSSTPKLRWWERKWSRLKRGAHAAGALSFRILVPLCVATAIVPIYYDNPGLSCVEIIMNTAHRLIQPYCSVQHIGLPPI
ncbi:inositol 1,4,5-triphosphate receptor associated 2-like isoform X1 [Anguilla anguilla]|uniref:inositol 1,4,5-triphosphate receptor associated 2-like isoform X1 n=1 Tax=Anguilla anguilla TaxID=7936 RepID=UPI0015B0C42A|nr:inositol 1,4,5-triphosphate receptor associated 2-like isoform X1 [Anguilla anguilla]XP_035269054.1 inositol 1,4,5-triphosphate receptor associated 2-like isoform X1 [Anguilla anguilla]XP_035269055.1 inositol 1,4,5-triphosphate receptor associated 2-like isoform X1 [Anguilla anguilla]